MLQFLIENNPKLEILTKTYPSVERFIQQALEIVPENRPTLPILKADEELDQFYVETFRHSEVKTLVKLLRSDKIIIKRGAVQYLTDRVLQEGLNNDATTLKALRNGDGITKLKVLKRTIDQQDIKKNIDKIINAHMMPIVAASFSPPRTSFFRTLANIHDVDITNPVISWLFPG